ncbi:MAG TPA: hypothetical protein VNU92_08095 [Edaphobacter sp.]|jgi:hypothetical protein|nr:hypothetical protein [Edaphobacter sp.]
MSERTQRRCIVLLPPGPHYDRLFNEILDPVLFNAGLASYQFQRDSPSIPIDIFVDEIEQAEVLFADVSENTPEIWIAAGCAMALGKPLVLISSDAIPLGIQYPLIPYPADAFPGDYIQLQQNIADRLSSALAPPDLFEPEPILHAPLEQPPIPPAEDLAPYEVIALTIIDVRSTETGLSPRDLGIEMKIHDSAHLTSHAMNSLKRRQFIEKRPVQLSHGDEVHFSENLFLTNAGQEWLMQYHRRAASQHRSTSRARHLMHSR